MVFIINLLPEMTKLQQKGLFDDLDESKDGMFDDVTDRKGGMFDNLEDSKNGLFSGVEDKGSARNVSLNITVLRFENRKERWRNDARYSGQV